MSGDRREVLRIAATMTVVCALAGAVLVVRRARSGAPDGGACAPSVSGPLAVAASLFSISMI